MRVCNLHQKQPLRGCHAPPTIFFTCNPSYQSFTSALLVALAPRHSLNLHSDIAISQMTTIRDCGQHLLQSLLFLCSLVAAVSTFQAEDWLSTKQACLEAADAHAMHQSIAAAWLQLLPKQKCNMHKASELSTWGLCTTQLQFVRDVLGLQITCSNCQQSCHHVPHLFISAFVSSALKFILTDGDMASHFLPCCDTFHVL